MDIYDFSLVGKLKNGSVASFEIIYKSHYKKIYHFAFQYLQDEQVSHNIIQDVFSSLWDNREKLASNTNLNAWLFTVTKNKCLKHIRALKTEQKFFNSLTEKRLLLNYDALNSLDTSPGTFEEIEKIIRETLEKLPPQCRKVFELSRFEDKKYSEIAEDLQIAQKTVETHISNALKTFRIALKDYLPLAFFLLH